MFGEAEVDATVGGAGMETLPLPVIAGEGNVQSAIDGVTLDFAGNVVQRDAAIGGFKAEIAIDAGEVDVAVHGVEVGSEMLRHVKVIVDAVAGAVEEVECGPWSWMSPSSVSMTIWLSRSLASDSEGAQAVTRASRATSERSSPVMSIPPFMVFTLRWPEGKARVVRRIWQTWASPQWLPWSSQSPLCQLPVWACAAAAWT